MAESRRPPPSCGSTLLRKCKNVNNRFRPIACLCLTPEAVSGFIFSLFFGDPPGSSVFYIFIIFFLFPGILPDCRFSVLFVYFSYFRHIPETPQCDRTDGYKPWIFPNSKLPEAWIFDEIRAPSGQEEHLRTSRQSEKCLHQLCKPPAKSTPVGSVTPQI